MFGDARLVRIAAFLERIGIPVRAEAIDCPTTFPGVLIDHGSLIVDETKVQSPGDVLHEAAHIALAPPSRRPTDRGFLKESDGGEEITAIAWAWAALLHLEIPAEEVFHETAYKRGADAATLLETLRRGVYVGFPLLQAWDMAYDERLAAERRVPPYPAMVRWMRPFD